MVIRTIPIETAMLNATARSMMNAGNGINSIPTRSTRLSAITISLERSKPSRATRIGVLAGVEVIFVIDDFRYLSYRFRWSHAGRELPAQFVNICKDFCHRE